MSFSVDPDASNTTGSKPKVDVPILKDLTIDNITENVHRINSQADDARLKYVLERLVSHMHDFARETRLSTKEWMAGIEFLTAVGKKCTDVRQVRLFSHILSAINRTPGEDVMLTTSSSFRSSSSSPTPSASPFSSTPLTTPNRPPAPKAPSSAPIIRTTPKINPRALISPPTPTANRSSVFAP